MTNSLIKTSLILAVVLHSAVTFSTTTSWEAKEDSYYTKDGPSCLNKYYCKDANYWDGGGCADGGCCHEENIDIGNVVNTINTQNGTDLTVDPTEGTDYDNLHLGKDCSWEYTRDVEALFAYLSCSYDSVKNLEKPDGERLCTPDQVKDGDACCEAIFGPAGATFP